MGKLNICIDFDGTIVSPCYPKIGTPINGAIEKMKKWKGKGHIIIVSSCRAGIYEEQMREFLKGWPVDYINPLYRLPV